MSQVEDVLIDPWSFYTFKGKFDDRSGARAWAAPSWVTDYQDRRRLQAYVLLDSYTKNMARAWLNKSAKQDDIDNRREYGDPSIIIDQIRASVLGTEFGISVPGAEEPVQSREDDQSEDPEETPEYAALQLLKEWAEAESFNLKVIENEDQAIKFGDSVMQLGWSTSKERPVLNVWDPGFYFPVWSEDGSDDEGMGEEFPSKVHLAYEWENSDNDKFLRRITYEMRDGTCLMSDGDWRFSGGGNIDGVYDLSDDAGVYRTNAEGEEKYEVDIELDFIPVVYFPNFHTGQYQWSVSCLAPVMQLFDDITATDTDLQASGSVAGTPPIAVSGATLGNETEVQTYGPRTMYQLGDGTMSTIDTSSGFKTLIEYKNELLERLSINSKVPESMLGRVKPSDVPSGIALWLSFAPHSAMVTEMRMVRKVKYGKLLDFVQRMYDVAEPVKATLAFGSYLPADMMETIKMVVEAMNAGVNPMSLETAVTMLKDAGAPIEDVQAEVRRIEKRQFDEALQLIQATGDINAGRRMLGLEDEVDPVAGDEGPEPTEDETQQFF